ncbi:MAG: glycosyltransferase family 39 protein [Deltaproteobacteria bacterium]|nr:glycosyltransferase family 39 protein [Deltaproteobacteria bacterium]
MDMLCKFQDTLPKIGVILIFCVAGVFLFFNLDGHYLWKDEAETALLGRSILEKGLPSAFLGKNQIHIHLKEFLRSDGIWTFHPWLPFYVTAGSFRVLGESTISARLPFAILGFLALIATYFLALQLSRSKLCAWFSVVFLTCSIPFMLHMRECRYYAPAALFSVLMILGYIRFFQFKKYTAPFFVIISNLLFHSNYGIFLPIQMALILHAFIFYRREPKFKSFLAIEGLVFMMTFPWFVYFNGFQHSSHVFGWKHLSHHLQYYFRLTYKFIFPVFFVVGLYFYQLIGKKKEFIFTFLQKLERESMGLLGMILLVSYAFVILGDQRFYRYVIHLVPIYMILLAMIFTGWFRSQKWVASVFFLFMIGTNVFYYSLPFLVLKVIPEGIVGQFLSLEALNQLKTKQAKIYFSPVSQYVDELTHPADDMNQKLAAFFLKRANQNDAIGIAYSDHSLMFYTDFKIINLYFEKEQYPEWIVFQPEWFEEIYGPLHQSSYVKKMKTDYDAMVTDIADHRWGQRPDPYEHAFRSEISVPRIVIYRKKKG